MKIDPDGKIRINEGEELPAVGMSFSSTSVNKTGSWRFVEPYYQDNTPPCNKACLVGNDIVMSMRFVEAGDDAAAAKVLLQTNPFPATTGRVCPHPCEKPCNRKAYGGAIAIQSVERMLGDFALDRKIDPDYPVGNQGIRIAVIGAGPAGLAAAYFLRIDGFSPVVFEKEEHPGGLLRYGIPRFRLPLNILDGEIQRLRRMEISILTGEAMGRDITLHELASEYGAVLVAVGNGGTRKLGILGEETVGVVDGVELLKEFHRSGQLQAPASAVIVGGGNTALDCARVLRRLGSQVRVLYRRGEKEMPASKEEIAEAREEGIQFEFLAAPASVRLIEEGKLELECIRMKLGEPDSSGRARPEPVPGSEYRIECGMVVKALGEVPSIDIPQEMKGKWGEVKKDEKYFAGLKNVYACGDCTGSGGTVGDAIRQGREAADAVRAFLKGGEPDFKSAAEKRGAAPETAKFKEFNMAFFSRQTPPEGKCQSPEERVSDFREVKQGLDHKAIDSEAKRCFKCGTCTGCDNCYVFCPDMCVSRVDGTYVIDYEHCKGCGVCVEECPRGAIHLRRLS